MIKCVSASLLSVSMILGVSTELSGESKSNWPYLPLDIIGIN